MEQGYQNHADNSVQQNSSQLGALVLNLHNTFQSSMEDIENRLQVEYAD